MIATKIPTLKYKPETGHLRVTMSIGSNGFKRSDIYKKWAPNQTIYVDNETETIEYSVIGKDKDIVKVSLNKPQYLF